jgi:hypothetical protein
MGQPGLVTGHPGLRLSRPDSTMQDRIGIVHVEMLVEDEARVGAQVDESQHAGEGDDNEHQRDNRAARAGAAGAPSERHQVKSA